MRGSYLFFATAVAVMAAGSTMAEEASVASESSPTSGRLTIESIVVEAERREESEQSVSIAVSAMDEKRIDLMNSRNIQDVVGVVPNLVITTGTLGPSLANISMRGVNFQDPEKSFDPGVGVFIDGIYLGTSAFNLLDTFDLERLEVLRGPQGTLFGRNTTGGVISAYRSRPTGEFGGKASAIFGRDGRTDFKAVVNAPIVADKLAIKVGGYYQHDNGLWDNPNGGPSGAIDRWSGTVSLLFTPTDNFELQVTYDHAEDDSELTPYAPRGISGMVLLPIIITQTSFPVQPAVVVAAHGPDRLCLLDSAYCAQTDYKHSYANGPHFQNSKLDAVTVNSVFRPSDSYEITAIFGWRKSMERVYIDFDGTPLTVFDVVRNQPYEQFSGELRVASSYDSWFNFVAGMFFFESKYSLRQAIKLDLADLGVAVPLSTAYVNGNGDEDDHKSRTFAVFGQADAEITDTLTLSIGLRATWDRKRVATAFYSSTLSSTADYQVTDGIPANRTLTSSGSASESWFEVTPKATLSWQAADNVLLYLSFSRGYNAGGFSGRAGNVTDVTTPFDPEYINAYEAGVKSDLLGGRLRLNASVFVNDYKDKQEQTIAPAPAPVFTSTTVRNVAGARVAGFELEMAALITEEFRIDGSFGYLDAKYTNFDSFLGSGEYISTPGQPWGTLVAADLTSLKMRRTPAFTASLSPTLSFQAGPGYLTTSVTLRFVSSYQFDPYNDPRGRLPSELLVDAYVSYAFGGPDMDNFEIRVFGKNLTNEIGFGHFTNSIVDFGQLKPPAQWGIELNARF